MIILFFFLNWVAKIYVLDKKKPSIKQSHIYIFFHISTSSRKKGAGKTVGSVLQLTDFIGLFCDKFALFISNRMVQIDFDHVSTSIVYFGPYNLKLTDQICLRGSEFCIIGESKTLYN